MTGRRESTSTPYIRITIQNTNNAIRSPPRKKKRTNERDDDFNDRTEAECESESGDEMITDVEVEVSKKKGKSTKEMDGCHGQGVECCGMQTHLLSRIYLDPKMKLMKFILGQG